MTSIPGSHPTPETRPHQSGEPDAELLQAVLDRAGIRQWDVLLFGDGSGSQWGMPAGWAGVVVDRQTRGRKLLYMAINECSINLAESMPYWYMINWYDQVIGKQRLKDVGVLNIHVITDSQVVATWGTKATQLGEALPRKHLMVWAGVRELCRMGYRYHFHWAPRSTSLLNWSCDLVAGMARRQLQAVANDPLGGVDYAQRALDAIRQVHFADPTGVPINLYDLNHDAE